MLNDFTNIFTEYSQLNEVCIIICILQMKKLGLEDMHSLSGSQAWKKAHICLSGSKASALAFSALLHRI